ncbi:glutathione S-transferase family protein [Pacificimonas flava]|uniref:Glutathione S-transferase n=1 Tax=Pacificimonas flava TaxID=1234595 RepID=M2U5V6_9SPHN|nr:glutathione S-transferase family protein [Pacificimonas flava]EMD83397.1 glutathione S-transferase [Pacificimonas flava]MBB5279041.1 glutathione S-transferase [Pacificimonas flava]
MYRLYGLRPSFYTRKVAAMLTAMRLPHEDLLKSADIAAEIEAAVDGYRKFPVVETPEGDWLKDSTDIGLALDAAHPDRSILPDDPAMRAAALMLDDWIDEWLIRPVLHWRVTDEDNRRWTARHAVAGMNGEPDPGEDSGPAYDHPGVGYAMTFFAGAGAVNRVGADYENEVLDLLTRAADALSAHFEMRPFLLGTRISLPDFALYGMLEAGLLWEPAARAYVEPRWPALRAFKRRVEGVEAGEGVFDTADTAPPTLAALVRIAGDDFADFLAANARALAANETGATWAGKHMRTRGFTEKCRQATGRTITALTDSQKESLRTLGADRLMAAYLGDGSE